MGIVHGNEGADDETPTTSSRYGQREVMPDPVLDREASSLAILKIREHCQEHTLHRLIGKVVQDGLVDHVLPLSNRCPYPL